MSPQFPAICLIYARARNGVIGRGGVMPWHLPEDLAHFRKTTVGCPVIMGRKTWDSLPTRFRPLPGRTNVVITRQIDWQAPGANVAHGLEQAITLCTPGEMAWVIGGAEIYAQALPLAARVVVTEIDADFEGDAYAPELGPEWHEVTRDCIVSGSGLSLAFVTYARDTAAEKTD